MKEDFLHFVWMYRLYSLDIRTTDDKSIVVRRPGDWNLDAGPDFSNALILIDGTCWAGQVEIHVKSSDWVAHGHHLDPAYNNVILHVVYVDDEPVKNLLGEFLPTLALSGFIPPNTLNRYLYLQNKTDSIPCENYLQFIDHLIINGMLEKCAAERFEGKESHLLKQYRLLNADPEVLAFESFARAMGFRVNADAFSLLVKHLNLSHLRRMQIEPVSILAVVLGASGLLEDMENEALVSGLSEEWEYRRKTMGLMPIKAQVWRYGRTRPYNFPHRRLIQWAAFLSNGMNVFHTLADFNDLQTLEHKLVDHFHIPPEWVSIGIKPEDYAISSDSILSIIINVALPLNALILKLNGNSSTPLALMEDLPPESNSIVRQWIKRGVHVENILHSQGCLHLYHKYCKQKKCLFCSIGVKVMSQG